MHHPSSAAERRGRAVKTAAHAIALQKRCNKTTAKTACPTFRASILAAGAAGARPRRHRPRSPPRSRRMRSRRAVFPESSRDVRRRHFLCRRRRQRGQWWPVPVPATIAAIVTTARASTESARSDPKKELISRQRRANEPGRGHKPVRHPFLPERHRGHGEADERRTQGSDDSFCARMTPGRCGRTQTKATISGSCYRAPNVVSGAAHPSIPISQHSANMHNIVCGKSFVADWLFNRLILLIS